MPLIYRVRPEEWQIVNGEKGEPSSGTNISPYICFPRWDGRGQGDPGKVALLMYSDAGDDRKVTLKDGKEGKEIRWFFCLKPDSARAEVDESAELREEEVLVLTEERVWGKKGKGEED